MSWILDVFLVLLFLLIVYITAERGFVKSIWGALTIVGAFVLAYIFGPIIGEWVCNSFVSERFTSYAYGVVEKLASEQSGQYDLSVLFETLPDEFTELLRNCGADIDQLSEQFNVSVTVTKEELFSFAETISGPLARTVSNAIGILGIFIVSVIALWLVGLAVKAIVKLPLINTLNGFLGLILGITQGLIIIWVLCITLGIFAEQNFMNQDSTQVLRSLADGSRILNFFCSLSPIDFINIK